MNRGMGEGSCLWKDLAEKGSHDVGRGLELKPPYPPHPGPGPMNDPEHLVHHSGDSCQPED